MKPSSSLHVHRKQIIDIALRHRVQNVRVLGSVLHGEDTENSDLDILVDPMPNTTLLNIGAIQYELSELLGVTVHVFTPKAIPPNIRCQVIGEAKPIDDI